MSRERHVYPTGQIAHKWAHQTQSNARNPQGNMSFDGARLYSYSTCVAKLHFKKKEVAALISERQYSVTTAGHLRDASGATSHLARFIVPAVEPYGLADHGKNLDYLLALAAGELAKAKRALQSSGVNWRQGNAHGAHSDALAYAKFFGIRRKIADFLAVEWAAAFERARAIENPDPVRDAKRFKAREQRVARAVKVLAEYQERLTAHCAQFADTDEQWRRGETDHLSIPAPYWWNAAPRALRRQLLGQAYGGGYWGDYGRNHVGETMLRVKGDIVQTSRGAEVPADHARRIWPIIQRVVRTGQAYKRNGHTEHIGEFAVDAIEVDGTMRAGCHTIAYGELERCALALGCAV